MKAAITTLHSPFEDFNRLHPRATGNGNNPCSNRPADTECCLVNSTPFRFCPVGYQCSSNGRDCVSKSTGLTQAQAAAIVVVFIIVAAVLGGWWWWKKRKDAERRRLRAQQQQIVTVGVFSEDEKHAGVAEQPVQYAPYGNDHHMPQHSATLPAPHQAYPTLQHHSTMPDYSAAPYQAPPPHHDYYPQQQYHQPQQPVQYPPPSGPPPSASHPPAVVDPAHDDHHKKQSKSKFVSSPPAHSMEEVRIKYADKPDHK
ncbi:hypothetical protein HDU97_003208 [Phlyctochytrium planicorne]|nr:hypothetical protein HDU97_003208 [Phlyctochytrium planicorne]